MKPSGDFESAASPASLTMRVDGLLEHAETLGKSAITAAEYYGQVLGELSDILSAHSVAVWSVREDRVALLFDTQAHSDQSPAAEFVEPVGRVDVDRTVIVPPGVGGRWPNNTEFVRCLACVSVAPELRLVLDVRRPPAAPPLDNVADIVAAMASILVEFHRGRQLARMFSLLSERDRIAGLSQTLHSTLDRHHIALHLANDGAAALRVDRVSVLLADDSSFRLEAATAVQELNRRANSVRAIEQLVTELRDQKTSLPWTTVAQEHSAARNHLQESGATRVRVEPLGPRPNSWDGAHGAIVLEMFGTESHSVEEDHVPEVARHATAALANAVAFESKGLGGRWLHWRSLVKSHRARTIAAVVVGAMLLLTIIPADLVLEAPGQVQPARRRSIYSPTDGIITQVSVENAARVAAEDVLAVVRNPELELEEQRVRGDISTTNARLAAIRAARIDDRRSSNSASAGQLAAEEEELKQSLASLNRQLDIVNRRAAELTLRSPLAGQVVRWDLIRALEARPVRQGQLLMQVVDLDGPWEIDLRIPDRHVRHVLAAKSATKNGSNVPVRFLFRMAPQATYSSTLDTVGLATELDQDGELSTRATVSLNPKDIPDLRPGSSVIAKIHCGSRSLGYVWLRELLEFLQTRVLF